MLPSHQQADHQVSDFCVREWRAGFVRAGHERPEHVFAVLFIALGAARADDVGVDFCHCAVGRVAAFVLQQRRPREHEVNGLEAVVKVMVEIGERGVEFFTHFASLQAAGGGEEGQFGHDGGDLHGAESAWGLETSGSG